MVDIEQVLSQVHFMAPTIGVVISGLLACVLLVASGFASGSEIAIFRFLLTILTNWQRRSLMAMSR